MNGVLKMGLERYVIYYLFILVKYVYSNSFFGGVDGIGRNSSD